MCGIKLHLFYVYCNALTIAGHCNIYSYHSVMRFTANVVDGTWNSCAKNNASHCGGGLSPVR